VSELEGASHTAHPRLATSADAARDADLVLVTVKSAQTAEAARELAPVISPTTIVVSLQNGVRNVGVLRDTFGPRVRAGMVPFNVIRPEPGHYHRASGGTLMFEPSPLAEACRRARLPYQLGDDMGAVQWAKLVLNLNNAINALSNLPLAAELADRGFRRCFGAALLEAVDVIGASGQRLARLTPLPMTLLGHVMAMPDAMYRLFAKRVATIDPTARSSMWDDLEQKRPTEVDYIQGEIVALADKLGRDAPVNRALMRLIKAAEQGGKRQFTGLELYRAITRPTT
jgi:2-dehydropantoate 2-reductase